MVLRFMPIVVLMEHLVERLPFLFCSRWNLSLQSTKRRGIQTLENMIRIVWNPLACRHNRIMIIINDDNDPNLRWEVGRTIMIYIFTKVYQDVF